MRIEEEIVSMDGCSASLSYPPTTQQQHSPSTVLSSQPLRDPSEKLKIREFYRNKTLLCTGCTGFLGKVMIEKLLRCIPELKKAYILVRPKKGGSPKDRMIEEILRSPIMSRLIQQHGSKEAFEEYALTKLEAVPGDVATPEFIHLPDNEKSVLRREINVLIHSAATVGFQERLDDAIKLNVYGAVRAMEFAKSCPNIFVFSHISTAYVNSNMKSGSRVMEKQYPLKLPGNEDPEDFCKRVLQMSPEEIEKTTQRYLKHYKYPNTYTFTKRLAETLVTKKRESLPIAVIRPTIVGAALKEPFPGWVDTISAGGSVYLFVGLGVVSLIPGDLNKVSDQVPVDFVANAMIVCTADVGSSKERDVCRTYHIGTSVPRPGKWSYTVDGIMRYWSSHQPSKAIAPASFQMINNKLLFNTQFFMRYTWLSQVYSIIAAAMRNKKHLKIAKGLQKVESKANMFNESFRHFTMNEWFYETTNLESAFAQMSQEEQKIFSLDFSEIDWGTYFEYFCYGLHKWILKENPEPPTKINVLRKNQSDFLSDITFTFSAAGEFNNRWSRDDLKNIVLGSARVQAEIQKEAERLSLPYREVEDRAHAIMEQMFANPKTGTVRFLSWLLRKIWRKLYGAIIVNSAELEKVKELIKDEASGSIVFIPTHRSYIDFLILSYIFFAYSLPVPHVAAGEDFLNMFLVRDMFRHSGAFFIRRQFGDDLLYRAIFTEYVQQLLIDGCPVEFFVEGTRSRNGKTLQPKMGLLSIITESYLERKVPNITIVPVNISYERILEGEAYSTELLGEPKTRESLSGLIKARDVLRNKYGDIQVKIAAPISLKNYVSQISEEYKHEHGEQDFDPFINESSKLKMIRRLAYSITHELNVATVIMPTALVATLLLTYRSGISLDELMGKTTWLKEQICMRGGRVNWEEQESSSAVVDRALNLLNNLVVKRKHMIEPAIEAKADYKKTIQLSCYKNQLIHLFVEEAFVSCALESFANAKYEGVLRSDLVQSSKYLASLFAIEFTNRKNPDQPEDFDSVIDTMIHREIIKVRTDEDGHDRLYISSQNINEMHKFLCSLLWPFVESYWATCMAMISLNFSGNETGERDNVKESVLLQRIQWLAEKLYFDSKLYYYESCSIDTIKNAIATFLTWNVVKRVKKQETVGKGAKAQTKTEIYLHLLPPFTDMDKMFTLVEQIQRYRRPSVHPVNNRSATGFTSSDIHIPSRL